MRKSRSTFLGPILGAIALAANAGAVASASLQSGVTSVVSVRPEATASAAHEERRFGVLVMMSVAGTLLFFRVRRKHQALFHPARVAHHFSYLMDEPPEGALSIDIAIEEKWDHQFDSAEGGSASLVA